MPYESRLGFAIRRSLKFLVTLGLFSPGFNKGAKQVIAATSCKKNRRRYPIFFLFVVSDKTVLCGQTKCSCHDRR